MESILVTGANGFLASRFCEYYKQKYNVIPLKRTDLDITDEKKVLDVFKKYKPDYVLHTAAVAETKTCEDNPEKTYNINVTGAENVAKACAFVHSRMIFLSSEQVYNGNCESGPYSEDCTPVPNTQYGKQKLQAEKNISNIADDLVILRLTWMFGFPEKNRKVNANIVWNTIKVVFNGRGVKFPANEFRGMTYVYELIEKFEKILKLPGGIYNTGSENNLSTYSVACEVLKDMGIESRTGDIIIKDEEKYKDMPRDLRISNDKIKSYGISFSETKDAVYKCINDFSFKF